MVETVKREMANGIKKKVIEQQKAVQKADAEEAKKVDTSPPPEPRIVASTVPSREDLFNMIKGLTDNYKFHRVLINALNDALDDMQKEI
jgi:hypothetical protein